MAIRCQPCQAVLGAEVEGVDLRQVPDEATIDVLEEALERYGVLIFHAQHLAPAEHVAWSRAFGPLVMTQGTETRLPHCPEIFVVGNTIDPPVTFSPSTAHDDLEWHADNRPTVCLYVTSLVASSYGYDDGKSGPTRCALIGAAHGDRSRVR